MPFESAHKKALEDFRSLVPVPASNKSGAAYQDGRFTVRLVDRGYTISHPDGNIAEAVTGTLPSVRIQVLLLHYLIQATGASLADRWVAYRELPGAHLFEKRFQQMSAGPLSAAFGQDAEAFRRVGLAVGGTPMDRTGDAAFRFLALPRLPVACILNLGEDEIPPAVNVLFDASAPEYLPTEDLSILGLHLAMTMLRLKGSQ